MSHDDEVYHDIVPQVVNVKVKYLRPNGYNSLKEWLDASPDHIYIGRDMSAYVKGARGSKWKNPFTIKKYKTAKEACRLYRQYILNTPSLLYSLDELEGKVLGCWCKGENECHGDVLVQLIWEKKILPTMKSHLPLF
jgi:hypothetical protein